MTHARVIANPAAGAGKTAGKLPKIISLLKSQGLKFEHDITEAPGHAIELAETAAKKGYEMVVCIGGDGTINEVVNGISHAGSLGDVTLGIVSTGSGCDYIRTVGIPRSYEDACQLLNNPQKKTVDLGIVEYMSGGQAQKRLFVNFAGMGFDAEVVKATTKKFKAMGSMPSYLMGLLTTFLCYSNKKLSLTVDGKAEERKVCTILAGIGKYGGGGMMTTPNADPSDGLLDVLIIDDLSKLDLIVSLPKIYKGNHLTHPKVTVKRAGEVDIRPQQRMSVQADGELLGESPASFRILPGKLNIAV